MNLRDELLPDVAAALVELGTPVTLTRTTLIGGSKHKAGGKTPQTRVVSSYAVLGTETVVDQQGRQFTRSVATLLTQPLEGDKLAFGSSTYLVGEVTEIAPQGEAILWKAVVTG